MDADALETLVDALSTSPRDRWVVLPGVGWLSVKRYRAYERRPRTEPSDPVPDTRLPFFTSDPELDRALAGLPPSGVAFADERARYLRAIRPDGNDEEDDEDPATVIRTPGAEAIAGRIRKHLLAGEAADVPGLGVFDVIEKSSRQGADPETGEPIIVPARRLVRFLVAEVLKARLNSSLPSA
jgi:integration host factor subunit alpha